jgi:protein TonB
MKSPPFLFAAAVGVIFPLALSAQNTRPILIEPQAAAAAPEFLMKRSECGLAIVEGLIGADGKCSLGYVIALSQPDLAKPAVESARHWKYKAALRDGQPVPQMLDIPVYYRGDPRAPDDQLAPLVQVASYIYHGWLKMRGYRSFADQMGARKKGVSGVVLLRRMQTDFLYADKDRTPVNMQEAVPFVNKLIAASAFPEKTLAEVQRMGQFTVLLPLVEKKAGRAF